MFGLSDTSLAGILGALVLGIMMWLGLRYDNQAIIGAAMGIVLPAVIAALGILSRSNATSNLAHQESLDKIAEAEAKARHGDAQVAAKVERAVDQVVPTATATAKAVVNDELKK